jgi:hypothetical protein
VEVGLYGFYQMSESEVAEALVSRLVIDGGFSFCNYERLERFSALITHEEGRTRMVYSPYFYTFVTQQ